jgi:hypothetical protein
LKKEKEEREKDVVLQLTVAVRLLYIFETMLALAIGSYN